MEKQFQSMEHIWDMICQTGAETDTASIWCQSQETHHPSELKKHDHDHDDKISFQLIELPFSRGLNKKITKIEDQKHLADRRSTIIEIY